MKTKVAALVVGVGMLPLGNQFTLLGRAGVINATVKEDASALPDQGFRPG